MTMNKGAFSVPDPGVYGKKISLVKPISAIQLALDEHGHGKLGLLSQLGPGTTVECCGEGYNDRMVKVRVKDQYYFVFSQDLKSQKAAAF